jgi:hypothetical protein
MRLSWHGTQHKELRGMFSRRVFLAVAAALVISACDDDGVGIAPGVAALRISPSDTTILFGTTVRLVVTAIDANGTAVSPQPPIAFEVDKPNIAAVDASGIVTTKTAGTVTVTARLAGANDGRIGRATIAIGLDVGGP